jgi:hypothetical protein
MTDPAALETPAAAPAPPELLRRRAAPAPQAGA